MYHTMDCSNRQLPWGFAGAKTRDKPVTKCDVLVNGAAFLLKTTKKMKIHFDT
jgi:hypothetical protein